MKKLVFNPFTGSFDLIQDLSGIANDINAIEQELITQQNAIDNKEDAFSKNTAFNKDFGVSANTVAEGNHSHNLSELNNDEGFISNNASIQFNQTTLELTFTDNEGNTTLIDFKKELESQLKTTNTISFDWNYIYGSALSPLTGTLSINNTNARIGYIQKIYHDGSTAPPYPASFKAQGTGTYLENASAEGLVNTIFVEWSSNIRQIYWITQEEL